jgi:hypothetical protein
MSEYCEAGDRSDYERPFDAEHDDPAAACCLCWARVPKRPPACRLCRHRLAARLWELRDLHALLLAALGPGRAQTQRVSGSREAPLPLRVSALDFAGEAHREIEGVSDTLRPLLRTTVVEDEWTVAVFDGKPRWQRVYQRERALDEDGNPVMVSARDQAGAWSVAAVLDSWARDWSETLDLPLPKPEVPALVSWLSIHLTRAVDEHPAIQEFAEEVTTTLYAVRALLNVSRALIHLHEACPSCGHVALQRDPGGGDVECSNCRRTWPDNQFNRLAVVLADEGEAA